MAQGDAADCRVTRSGFSTNGASARTDDVVPAHQGDKRGARSGSVVVDARGGGGPSVFVDPESRY